MKQRLLAIAALLAALGSGVYFVNWNTAEVVATSIEIVDLKSCSVSNCTSPNCVAGNNHLADAGSPCRLRSVECSARKTDGGSRYWQVEVTAMRCPAAGGGFNWSVAVTDAGVLIDSAVARPFPCAWKPNAGAVCSKVDGGDPGVQNTMQPGQWAGAGCVRKACVEISGDSSAP